MICIRIESIHIFVYVYHYLYCITLTLYVVYYVSVIYMPVEVLVHMILCIVVCILSVICIIYLVYCIIRYTGFFSLHTLVSLNMKSVIVPYLYHLVNILKFRFILVFGVFWWVRSEL